MRRRLLIIGVTLAVIIIPAVVLLLVVDRTPSLQNTVYRLANQPSAANTNITVTNVNTDTDPLAADRSTVVYVARNFAELYGSGNNQNNFANLTAAQDWGTDNFNAYVDRTIAQLRLTQTGQPYQGTSTTAMVIKVTHLAAATAAVTVSTQRVETIDNKERTYYQDLLLDLVKVGADWKINAATWEEI